MALAAVFTLTSAIQLLAEMLSSHKDKIPLVKAPRRRAQNYPTLRHQDLNYFSHDIFASYNSPDDDYEEMKELSPRTTSTRRTRATGRTHSTHSMITPRRF